MKLHSLVIWTPGAGFSIKSFWVDPVLLMTNSPNDDILLSCRIIFPIQHDWSHIGTFYVQKTMILISRHINEALSSCNQEAFSEKERKRVFGCLNKECNAKIKYTKMEENKFIVIYLITVISIVGCHDVNIISRKDSFQFIYIYIYMQY